MHSLLPRVKKLFPNLIFQEGDEFRWSPKEKIITYTLTDESPAEHLLHEISHAELKHSTYSRDIELIAMERDAWGHARIVLGPQLGIDITSDIVENDLDTYRDWLHARSTCPSCTATGIQTDEKIYVCVACRATWRVNRAIGCALRRYTTKKRA